MATTEPRTKAMLAIRRNMRKKAAGQYSKMSAEDRQRLNSGLNNKVNTARKVPKLSGAKPSITTSRVKDSTGRETIKVGPDTRPTGKQGSTVLNKKPNDPRTLSMIKTESDRKKDTEKAALRKSLASTGRTGPKKESTQPATVPKKSLTQSEINKIIKTPRTALEIKKFLEGKVVRTGDRIVMDAWKYIETRISQKNAQTNENTVEKTRREAAVKEEARRAASADETKREGVREKRSTRIQISDSQRSTGNKILSDIPPKTNLRELTPAELGKLTLAERKERAASANENWQERKKEIEARTTVADPEGEKGRSTSAQETADADYKKTGGKGKLIKPAEDSVRGKLNKKIADAKKAAMRYYNDAVRAKALKEGEISIAQERAIWRKKVKEEIASKATSEETQREAIRASGNARDNRSASVRRTTQKLKDAAKAVAAAKASAAKASGSGSMQVNRPKASLEIEQSAIVAKFQAKKLAEEEARTKKIKARIARTLNPGAPVGQNVRGTGVGIGGGTLRGMR